jgi:uncharacterized protein (DUF3084 family)
MDVKSLIQKLTGTAPVAEVPTAEETQAAIEALNTKETELAAKEVELTDRETSLNQKEADLSEKESGILTKETELATKETELTEKETALATKEGELSTKETELNTRKENLDTEVSEAAQKLSVQGTAPVKPEAKDSKSEVVATYNAMPKGAEKIAYFQKHEAILRAAK